MLILETGWTWEYVDEEMTIPRIMGFRAVWKQTPPLRVALAALLKGFGGGSDEVAAGSMARVGSSTSGAKRDLSSYIDAFAAAGLPVVDNRRAKRE